MTFVPVSAENPTMICWDRWLHGAPKPAPAACCEPAEPAPCAACAVAAGPCETGRADESDPDTWPEWTLADRWDLGPGPDDEDFDLAGWDAEPEPAPKSYDLAGFIAGQADVYRLLGNGAGDLIAKALDDLAATVRVLNARTPGDYLARCEVLDAR